MPIPLTSIETVEIQSRGLIASGGSTSKATNFTYHFRRTSTAGAITHAAIDTAFQAAVGVPQAAALNARWSQHSNSVRYVDDALDAPVFFSHVLVGGVAGDSMSTIMSVYLLLRTGLRGKSYRGCKHLAPASEADTTAATDDILNAAALARFGALGSAILAGFTDANGNVWVPVILSKTLSQLLVNPTTVVKTDVTSVLVNKRLGRMKRRQVTSVY